MEIQEDEAQRTKRVERGRCCSKERNQRTNSNGSIRDSEYIKRGGTCAYLYLKWTGLDYFISEIEWDDFA
jgi:hypothetical protein